MTEIMNGEAMSIIDRSTFDRAAMSREYLEQLSRAELLALAKYLREMAVALNVNEGNRTDDLAWLHAVNEMGSIFDVSDSRPVTSTLDVLIHSDISRICGYGKTNPEDVSLMERDDVIRFLAGHRIYFAYNQEAGDGRQLLEKAKETVLEILRDRPLPWSAIHAALLQKLGTAEEFTPGVELYFHMLNERLIESSTVQDGDPILNWATMVRLAEPHV